MMSTDPCKKDEFKNPITRREDEGRKTPEDDRLDVDEKVARHTIPSSVGTGNTFERPR